MFYRRKIVLSFIQIFNNRLEKLRLQKLLFLYSRLNKHAPEYDFIPYKLGCFSYSLNADLAAMAKKKLIIESENTYIIEKNIDYLNQIKPRDKKYILKVLNNYGKMSNDSLIKHTYINYPYYATKSIIARKILKEHPDYLNEIKKNIPNKNHTTLYTIGYEGISLEHYLNKLIINDIKLLVDVRKNPLSMKFGFSKTLLKRYCKSINIDYIHVPEVGIDSKHRKKLKTQYDYDKLFLDYKKTTLKETLNDQQNILYLLQKYNRIALTCFESNICQCHRKHLAESIQKINVFDYKVIHL